MMMNLSCFAMVLLIKLAKATSPDALPAYVHFFDTENEVTAGEFDLEINKDIPFLSILDTEKQDPPGVVNDKKIAPSKSHKWPITLPNIEKVKFMEPQNPLITESKVRIEKEVNPTTSTDLLHDKNMDNDIFGIQKGKLPTEMSFTNTMQENKKEYPSFLFENDIHSCDSDSLAEKHHSFSDFFAQMIKFCMESISLVMDSFAGIIEMNSKKKTQEVTEKSLKVSTEKLSSFDTSLNLDYYDILEPRDILPFSKKIKKRGASELLVSSKSETFPSTIEETLPFSEIPLETLEGIVKSTIDSSKESNEGSISLTIEKPKEIKTENTPSSDSTSKSSSDATEGTTNGHHSSPFQQEETFRVSLAQEGKPILSDSTVNEGVVKATETSGIATKLINKQTLNDMQEDDLNAKLRDLPYEEGIVLNEEHSSSSLIAVGGTILVVAVLAAAGSVVAYKYRQRHQGQIHGNRQDPIMA